MKIAFSEPERRSPTRLVSHHWEKAPEDWAHSKTLARVAMAPAGAKRFGVRRPSAAFAFFSVLFLQFIRSSPPIRHSSFIIISFLLLALTAPAQNFTPKPLVESGPFVKIYDPSVGEKKPWYINDHCFIRGQDGTWHMFGITHQEPADPEREIEFAHATARTLLLQPWDKQPYALAVATNAPWNETHLWAPDVVFYHGLNYMFYCAGGTDHTRYKINLATSPDLQTWTRSPKNPMVVDGFDARDPFLLRVNGKWIMYYCATSKPEGGNHVVAYVTSDDLLTWTNRSIAFTDPSIGTGGGNTESPFVVQRGDSYYLFLGPRGDYDGTDVFVSHNPFHWDIHDRVGHIAAHAAEVVQDTDGKWYVSRAGWGQGGLYLAPLIWHDGKGL